MLDPRGIDLGVALSMTMDKRFVSRCASYGATVADAARAYVAQGRKCAICQRDFHWRDLVFDHNHSTARFRGLLCGTCNTGIGLLGDSPETLRRAVGYLQQQGYYGGGMAGRREDQMLAWMADIDMVAKSGKHLLKEHRVRASEHRLYHRYRAALGIQGPCTVCASESSGECLSGCTPCTFDREERANA